jgi:hypothetical protein
MPLDTIQFNRKSRLAMNASPQFTNREEGTTTVHLRLDRTWSAIVSQLALNKN